MLGCLFECQSLAIVENQLSIRPSNGCQPALELSRWSGDALFVSCADRKIDAENIPPDAKPMILSIGGEQVRLAT
jgi:hypothetical protein